MVEIVRCLGCGFRIMGFPAQYLNRRVARCPQCRMEIPLSVEDRLRLKRLLVDEKELAGRPGGGRSVA